MSTLRVNTLQDASGSGQPAMSGAAKAWVNFNGTGTVAIRASFNVSSITDNGTGQYTLNFSNAFANANYVVTGAAQDQPGGNVALQVFTPTASALPMVTRNSGAGYSDNAFVYVAVFR